MKPPINAYLYPTPEELDYQLALRRALTFDARNHIFQRMKELVPDADRYLPAAGLSDAAQDMRDFSLDAHELSTAFHRYLERYIPDNPNEFVWQSHSGKRYNVSDMATTHIFYALRMLFNHTVPPAFRVLGPGEVMKRYPDVPHWSPAYRQAAIAAFTEELNERDDLDGSLKYQFEDMQANTKTILVLGL